MIDSSVILNIKKNSNNHHFSLLLKIVLQLRNCNQLTNTTHFIYNDETNKTKLFFRKKSQIILINLTLYLFN